MIIVGIDCATKDEKVGLALGSVGYDKVAIREVCLGSRNKPAAAITEWLKRGKPALLALDAPLGWPVALAEELPRHLAGRALEACPDNLFSRFTDKAVQKDIGKKPLEVGANLIARTAYSALKLLETLRKESGLPIPLAWQWENIVETSAIEVYPAATLKALKIEVKGYKKKNEDQARRELIDYLRKYIEIPAGQEEQLREDDNVLDAVICVLAASDFLKGRCLTPKLSERERANREGWIWVRRIRTCD